MKTLQLLLIAVFLFSCSKSRNSNHRFNSPNKSKYAKVIGDFDKSNPHFMNIQVQIYDQKNALIAQIQTKASDRMSWDISWLSETKILVSSSDIGKTYIVYKNNKWIYDGPPPIGLRLSED
jgi:hypothetical protein